MRKLLSANFSRLWKDKIFWLEMVLILIISIGNMIHGCELIPEMVRFGYSVTIDNYYYSLFPVLGLFLAIFIALFLGTEYSDGTFRNKLVVGHTRVAIYLANFTVCFVAGMFFMVAWMIGGLVGVPFFGGWVIGVQGFITYFLIAFLAVAAQVGIMVLLSMLSSNKAITAIATILFFFGLLIVASIIYNRLCEPELYSGVEATMEGIQMTDPSPNPDYLSGTFRTIYEWILDILPTGQGLMMANVEIVHPLRNMLSSIVIAMTTTIFGVVSFQKKNLK